MTDVATMAKLRAAVLQAAREVGADGEGGGEFVGFFRRLESAEPAVFGGILAKLLLAERPAEAAGTQYADPDEVRKAMLSSLAGITKRRIAADTAIAEAWALQLAEVDLDTVTVADIVALPGVAELANMMFDPVHMLALRKALAIQAERGRPGALHYRAWLAGNPMVRGQSWLARGKPSAARPGRSAVPGGRGGRGAERGYVDAPPQRLRAAS